MFVASILFYVAAAVLGILFWVWAVRGIVAKIYKNTFGKKKCRQADSVRIVWLALFFHRNWLFDRVACDRRGSDSDRKIR